ncbi:MAG: tRNA epoxyqueuosine(34) reductase QueG [Bacteroidia bacterium]|nr:tRNA epoxyqueuosine(34) reductase QueG [Bacteroidia bacterium]MDW8235903.1 tRNA epoxyqueuosine(34) reductase QueG [Bacteroidia bacterium]
MSLALTQAVRSLARGLGFDACGIAPVFSLEEAPPNSPAALAYQRYLRWIEEGKHADMHYLAENPKLRSTPESLLPQGKSLVFVLQSYFHTKRAVSVIAQYAWGKDYHTSIRRRLQIIADYLMRHGAQARPFVDSAPILEKAWAVEAGLGWIGKNTLLIHPKLGTYTFIGGVITTAELLPDEPFQESLCGTCQRCIEACPTGALTPYQIDARRCIAYWTIEAPSLSENAPSTGKWVFGCDICQQVCPWNRFARPQGELDFRPKAEVFLPPAAWAILSRSQLKKIQQGSALRRARPEKIQHLAQLAHERISVVPRWQKVFFDSSGTEPTN